MNRYRVTHLTQYEYEVPVLHSHHLAHIRPARLPYQQVQNIRVHIDPGTEHQHLRKDYFGNECDVFELDGAHDVLKVEVTSDVSVSERPTPPDQIQAMTVEKARLATSSTSTPLKDQEFCFNSPLVRVHRMLRDYVGDSFGANRSFMDALVELNTRIFDEFTYAPASTDITTPLAEVMRQKRGVCQDFAHVAIGCLRTLGFAARYVSGYIETLPPEGKPRLVGADASHAWISVLVPTWGWLDLDPTNSQKAGEQHISVAFGRDFSDVSPLKGVVIGGGRHRLRVAVDVAPVLPATKVAP